MEVGYEVIDAEGTSIGLYVANTEVGFRVFVVKGVNVTGVVEFVEARGIATGVTGVGLIIDIGTVGTTVVGFSGVDVAEEGCQDGWEEGNSAEGNSVDWKGVLGTLVIEGVDVTGALVYCWKVLGAAVAGWDVAGEPVVGATVAGAVVEGEGDIEEGIPVTGASVTGFPVKNCDVVGDLGSCFNIILLLLLL